MDTQNQKEKKISITTDEPRRPYSNLIPNPHWISVGDIIELGTTEDTESTGDIIQTIITGTLKRLSRDF